MKMKKNIFTIVIIGMMLSSCFVITSVADSTQPHPQNGTTLYVGGSGPNNFTAIQDAINNSANGDTVYVYSGVYYENIVVNRTIFLIGENRDTTMIDGGEMGDTVTITSNNVNISNFIIRGGSFSAGSLENFSEDFEYGVVPYGWLNVDDDGDGYKWEVDNTTNGWPSHSGEYTALSASFINEVGPLFPENWLITPFLKPSDESELNYWIAAQDPVWSEEHIEVWISTTGTEISDFTDQVDDYTLPASSDNWVRRDIDLSSYSGEIIYIAFVHTDVTDMFYIKLDDINVTDVFSKFAGIKINSNGNTITFCNITENDYGICVDSSLDEHGISSNRIYNSNIYHNNFVNNIQNAYDHGTNAWDNGLEGNYWDDYNGEDNNGNGIGDTPYNITGGLNQDNYPLMVPYGEGSTTFNISITDEAPINNSLDVSRYTPNVSALISIVQLTEDTSDFVFAWEIGGTNITTTANPSEYMEGRKEAPINGPLEYNTTYEWYVNVSFSGQYKNVTYRFTTEEPPNQPPVANFTYFIRDLTVFVNASSSIDSDGSIASYSWNFSHGTNGTEKITNHTYEENGVYDVNLTVTDDDGATNSKIITIEINNTVPIADFTYIFETNGKVVVKFDASKSEGENETIVSYFWEFGDGKNGTGKTINHEYEIDSKAYEVNLTVTDSSGLTNTTSKLVPLPDMTNPTIKIDQPLKGLYINGKFVRKFLIRPALIIGDVIIKVNASDSGSGIKYVELWIGNELKENKTTGMFDYVWTRDRLRLIHIFKIKVVAYDNEGNSASKSMFVKKYL